MSEKKELDSRENIKLLVTTFYGKVREDELIGDFFNKTISDWPHHFEQLTDFWEGNLLMKPIFRGRPGAKHIMVDRSFDGAIEKIHFARWLNLWHQTLDEGFTGPKVDDAKTIAVRAAAMFFSKIEMARQIQ